MTLKEVFEQLPRYPGDDSEGYGRTGCEGYVDRLKLIQDVNDIRSCFEFGGHFGQGLVTWLYGYPQITWAGWSDNEGAHAGSNAACEENVRAFLKMGAEKTKLKAGRRCQLWYTTRPIEAVGLQADLVMVDGDHSMEATLIDLSLAFAMRPKVVLVDDMQLPQVRQAVDHFSAYTGISYDEHSAAAGTAIFRS